MTKQQTVKVGNAVVAIRVKSPKTYKMRRKYLMLIVRVAPASGVVKV